MYILWSMIEIRIQVTMFGIACSLCVAPYVGYGDMNKADSTAEELLHDVKRVEYMAAYLDSLSTAIREDFAYFADVCFKSFGDRVKYWVTFNEPDYQVKFGYLTGTFPPSRCSRPFGNCTDGDSEKEPFVAAHNIILAHIAAVHIYRTKYQAELVWQNAYPQGLDKILTYLKDKYHNIRYGNMNKADSTTEELLHDAKRAEYIAAYLGALSTAIRKGANVKGYFAWSLLDNFEWNNGYTIQFGLYHVDHETLTRTPKLSATWYKNFLAEHSKVKYQQQAKDANNSSFYY
ncbi:hypothetical protein V6N13_132302 [Hibiscus sabdariffa]